MFKKTAIIAGLGLAMSGATHAQEKPQEAIVTGDKFVDTYRWEAGAKLSGGDNDSISVDGTFYLNPVDTSKGPYAEAAFLDHSSFVTANYTRGESDGDIIDGLEYENYGIAGRYITDEAGWIVDLAYKRSEPDNPFNVGPDDFEIDQYAIGGGKYLTDVTTLVFTYVYAEGDDDRDFDRYSLELEHLFQWSWGDVKADASYGLVDVDEGDDIDIYQIGATYYPNNNLGFGAAYVNTEENSLELEAYSVFAEWFITEKVAASVEYRDAEFDDSDVDADAVVFGVIARF